MRAFIGIALPDAVRSSLASLQRHLSESGADVKWVEAENLHVTLKFLDEITDEQRRRVEELLTRVAGGEGAFTLGLKQVGAFPSTSSPRVLWVGLEEGRDAAMRIAQAIEQEGQAISLRREDLPAALRGAAQAGRPFAAHVTLGRVRTPRNRAALSQRLQEIVWSPPEAWRVSTLTLYQSVLSSAGPRYNVLAAFPLRNPQSVGSP